MARIFAQYRHPRIVAVTPAGAALPAVVSGLDVEVQHRWPDPASALRAPGPLVLIVDAQDQPAEMLSFVKALRVEDEQIPIVGVFRSFGLLSLTPAQGVTDFVTDEAGSRELGLRLERAVARSRRRPAELGKRVRTASIATTITLSEHGFGVRILDRDIRLSAMEHELIRLLLANRDRVLEHVEIARALTAVGCKVDPAAVRIVVSRTRAKLGPDARTITTVRGVGYRLVLPRRLEPVLVAS